MSDPYQALKRARDDYSLQYALMEHKAKKARRSSKPSVPVAPAVKRYVKKAIASNSETKITTTDFTQTTLTAVALGTPPAFVSLLPAIGQGDDNGERVGTRIKLKELRFKGTMNAIVGGDTSNRQIVTLVIGKLKDNNDAPTSAYWDVIQHSSGGLTDSPATVALYSKAREWNRDVWDIFYEKEFKIGPANSTTIGFTNNDFSLCANWNVNCTKFVRKNWTYATGNNFPQSEGLYAFFIPYTHNSAAVITSVYVNVEGAITAKYSDA